ncbi:plastocyanin/azurin family copper-binding protein [Natronorubrum tibetense]|uniref:Halocyanin domain protein n=1 Tax=Natronorubrum tibetense GA33 TaxID=1114856 RepID=L9VL21_9EURY|nr:plastocyanin/azurin family copper-binding protein [Natronorubrum tibetense]ELY37657.1 halocyanin domain protein [Natronorubrum tibetense GA33]
MKSEKMSIRRRKALKVFGVGITGSTMIAGCLGADDDDEPEEDDDGDTEAGDNGDTEAGDDADLEEIEDWLNEEPTSLDVLADEPVEWGDGVWDGEMVDYTGEDTVNIEFSAMLEVDGEVLGPFAADPRGVEISPGTTVTWEWGGEHTHTLTSHFDPPHESPEDGAADAFAIEGDEEEMNSHEHVFEEPGVYLYYCFPHGTPYETDFAYEDKNWFGHRGAIRVVED